ncbi:MAG TPA: protein translocase subunit SecF [Ignavibacteria bacterium]|nr:protein translocase subunit SecF [Ignavibacteria bacterium]
MRLFENTNIDFLGKRHLFYIVSIIIIIIGMVVLALRGIPLGIDFLGGTEMQVRFSNPVDVSEVRNLMDNSGFTGMEIKTMGTPNDVLLRTPMQAEGTVVSDKIQEALNQKFGQTNTFNIQRTDKVGPKIGSELRRNAFLAVLFSLVGILIYLAFRFQFVYALGAVIALFHDVLITISAVALFDALLPIQLEFSQTMLAAFLTLIGFSVNDTVIIFDRIRENIKLHKNEDIENVMNRSVNATLSRTIITSGTVFLTVLVIFIFGGEVLRSFSFTFGVGILTGTYSSVFVASAVVVDWKHKVLKNRSTSGAGKMA